MTTVPRHEILVVCLVESSVNLLHEWNEVLIGYISPLLQRIAAAGAVKGIKHEFRIGFVSYSDPCVHPNPILARRFFAQPLQLTKELKDDPASLGLGRTASGGRRGMAVLEGYVAVLEMFDALPATRSPLRPQPPNEAQQESTSHEPMCYLIHVATAPPNKATRPSWNTNPKLDAVTWASLPSELLKRNIRPSMILMSPVPELLELHGNISRTPEPFWQNIINPSHTLLFSGLPAIPKEKKTVPQKRTATENAEPPQQPPPPPRPQSQEQPLTPPVNPATNTTPAVLPNPLSTSPQRPGSVTSNQPPSEAQQPQPAPARPPNQLGQNLDPVKLLAFIRSVELECRHKLAAITQARAAGKPQAELDIMQAELNQKAQNRLKLVAIYQQLTRGQQQQQQTVGSLPNLNGATQIPQQMKLGQVGGQTQQAARPVQSEVPMTSNDVAASGSGQGGQASPPRVTSANFAATFGGGPNFANKNLFQNLPVSARPGMEAQMQKMLAERTRPPVLAAAPQSQPQALSSQNQGAPAAAQATSLGNHNQNPNPMFGNANANLTPNMADMMTPRANMGVHTRRWQGVLAWPSANPAARKENQIAIALFAQDANLRPESWPTKLLLQPSRTTFNMQQIQSWIAELKPSMALLSHTPIVGNVEATTQNMRLFRQLRDLIQQKNLLAYCKFDIAGGPPGTGFLTFPMNSPAHGHELLVAMIFVNSPLPAALTAQAIPVQAPPTDANSSNEAPSSQGINMGGGPPLSLQNMTPEAKAFLQQQQAAARAAYNQQQLVQQQAQQKGMVPNPQGVASTPFNMAQFMQNVQASGENPMGLGGLNLPQAPALQQVQHRQPSGFNPGQQMSNLQMLQYMNRRPDEGQGQ